MTTVSDVRSPGAATLRLTVCLFSANLTGQSSRSALTGSSLVSLCLLEVQGVRARPVCSSEGALSAEGRGSIL